MAPPPDGLTRRRFAVLGTQVVGAGVGVLVGVPIIGFLLNPLFRPRAITEHKVGYIGDVPANQPTKFEFPFTPQDAWAAPEPNYAAYVVRYGPESQQIRVFSNICTHMQCPVRWEPTLGQFLCPCHGGLYDITGRNVGGPPPRPLAQFIHRIDTQGILYVQNKLDEDL